MLTPETDTTPAPKATDAVKRTALQYETETSPHNYVMVTDRAEGGRESVATHEKVLVAARDHPQRETGTAPVPRETDAVKRVFI